MFRLLDTAINTEDYLLLKDETEVFLQGLTKAVKESQI